MTNATSPQATRRPGLYRTAGIVRTAVGVFFLVPATTKLLDYTSQTTLFDSWGFPAAGAVVIATGLLELVCGVLLAFGLGMPLPALALALVLVGALATAGVQDGGQNLVLPLVLLTLLGFVLSRGGGAYQRGTSPAFLRRRLTR